MEESLHSIMYEKQQRNDKYETLWNNGWNGTWICTAW